MLSATDIEECAHLVEHLLLGHKRKIVDPLIARLERLTAARFRRQGRLAVAKLRVLQKQRMIEADDNQGPSGSDAAAVAAIIAAMGETQDAQYKRALRRLLQQAGEGGAGLTAAELGMDEATVIPGLDNYIAQRVASSERDVDSTTLDRVRDAIKAADPSELVRVIQDLFATFAADRAAVIAGYEVSGAFHAGAIGQAKSSGEIVQKLWSSEPDACELCIENTMEGYIGIDDDFPNFEGEPPGHPNCRCSLEFRTFTPREE